MASAACKCRPAHSALHRCRARHSHLRRLWNLSSTVFRSCRPHAAPCTKAWTKVPAEILSGTLQCKTGILSQNSCWTREGICLYALGTNSRHHQLLGCCKLLKYPFIYNFACLQYPSLPLRGYARPLQRTWQHTGISSIMALQTHLQCMHQLGAR